jgi:hypothetical protein
LPSSTVQTAVPVSDGLANGFGAEDAVVAPGQHPAGRDAGVVLVLVWKVSMVSTWRWLTWSRNSLTQFLVLSLPAIVKFPHR